MESDQIPRLAETLTIQDTSRLLGVPAPTIRSWERRYGVPDVARSQGGHRRFTPDQLQQVRRMRDEIARGRPAAEAAAIVRGFQQASFGQPMINEFLQSAHRLDATAIAAMLDGAERTLGLERTIDEVLLPAMREIGRWWETGRCDVAHEHLATAAVSGWLTRALLDSPAPSRSAPVVLGCAPRDYHTLGLECMRLLLTRRGWDCRYLGAQVPATSLARAIGECDAAAAVVVSHLAVGRRAAIDALREAARRGARLFYAGDAFVSRQSRVRVPGDYLGTNLAAAADHITAADATP